MTAVLYEGMLAPVASLSLTGAICYQGEQNSPCGYQYRKILPAMIADWRSVFSAVPVDGDEAAETRESQAITAATIPNTCLAVTTDTADPGNIHAKEKEPVGDRLAPKCSRIAAHADCGLVVEGDTLGEFSIAGDERKWFWADARIGGDSVVVSSPSVPPPTQVRCAWQSRPAATLFNRAGLPAVPFRSDTWPGKTEGARPY